MRLHDFDETVVWHSNKADALKIDNKPDEDTDVYTTLYNNAVDLYNNIVRLIIDNYGEIEVNSWYRSPELNVAVKGSKTSQHCFGQAIDFTVPGQDVRTVTEWCMANIPEYGQCIYELGIWTHISTGTKKQNLSYLNGVYSPYTA